MHRQFRDLLDSARGESRFVLTANLDIRAFSAWSRKVESREMSLYLTKLYPKLIDNYFSDRWFFKPTGDGLLLVRAFDEPELKPLIATTVKNCFDIVDSFATLCDGEPMINFETPPNVGIGLAQGAASQLVASDPNGDGDLTLDYSGRVLNHASRLMELARPRGVVIDSGFGAGLIPLAIADRLKTETGYIRRVSPDDEVKVLYDPDLTQIPDYFKEKPGEANWQSEVRSFTLKQIEGHAVPHFFVLDSKPSDSSKIRCKVIHPDISASGKRLKGMRRTRGFPFVYKMDGRSPTVSVDFPALGKTLRSSGVKGPWPVTVRIEYPA